VRITTPTTMRRRFMPAFVSVDGRSFAPTAQRIWDLLLTESVRVNQASGVNSAEYFELSQTTADTQGAQLYAELLKEHRLRLSQERQRLEQSFDARSQVIGRIGLPAVRQFRRKHLQAEHDEAMRRVTEAATCSPELNAVVMIRVGSEASL